jgi:simple sugar transport system substrate-binding protein
MNRAVRFVVPAMLVLALILTACQVPVQPGAAAGGAAAGDGTPDGGQWCKGMKIRFFVGGNEGTPFAKIVDLGAHAATKDLGPDVEFVYSNWENEKMISQLRDAIASKPNGIAFMGHAGDDAVMPLAKEASDAGILMMYQNVDVPKVRAAYGGGYVGANLGPQGHALAAEAIRTLGLDKAKDHIFVIGPWGMPGRNIRELGVADEFEAQGFTVTKGDDTDTHGDATLLQPVITGAVLADPAIKVIVHSGSTIANHELFMTSLGKKAGEIYSIGFDVSPEILTGMEKGWIQLTSDQQPFMQGYMPILSLCQSWKYNLGAMNVDTGAGFVSAEDVASLKELAALGVR